jgi:hypothetical protein
MEIRDHSIEPVGILKHSTSGRQNRRVHVDRSMQVKPFMWRDTYARGAACAMHRRWHHGWRVLGGRRRGGAQGRRSLDLAIETNSDDVG